MTSTTTRIDPYKRGSKGARALSLRIGVLRATPRQVRGHGTFDTIINWGSSDRRFPNATYINDPDAVTIASSKLLTARRFGESHIPQPPYTTERAGAQCWLDDGRSVLCRTLLRGSGGSGITLVHSEDNGPGDVEADTDDNGRAARDGRRLRSGAGRRGLRRGRVLVDAPLYTQYVKKADEYRVHVFDGEVIDVQQKRKRQEVPNEEVDYQIRNASSGWVFCRDDVDCPDSVKRTAIRAVSVLGLDFGAVDIGFNHHTETESVYEVNTAPGLEGTTLDRYYEALERRLPYLSRGAYARRRA